MRPVSRLLAVVAIAYAVVVTTPLAWLIASPLHVASPPPDSADAIVLMSSGQIDATYPTTDATQRMLGALGLYRRGVAPVIVSSGSTRDADQASLQTTWLRRMGVPADAVIVEDGSTRTYESVLAIRAMMAARGWREIVFVTSDLDVPRLRAVARRAGVAASYLAVPTEPAPRGVLYAHYGAEVLWHAAYEYAAIVLYWSRGWL